MTTQPTPEEQVEAQRKMELEAWSKAGLVYRIQELERERTSLLTRQSQERAEIEKLGVKDPVLALQALRLDYEDLQAELDRAVEREKALRHERNCYREHLEFIVSGDGKFARDDAQAILDSFPEEVAASPGKGAEAIDPGPDPTPVPPLEWEDI